MSANLSVFMSQFGEFGNACDAGVNFVIQVRLISLIALYTNRG